jgi:hypothetical protein
VSSKKKYRLAVNAATGDLEWAPARPGAFQSIVGWVILAISTLAFLLVTAYVLYVFVLTSPRVDPGALPGGGSPEMSREVNRLRQSSHSN